MEMYDQWKARQEKELVIVSLWQLMLILQSQEEGFTELRAWSEFVIIAKGVQFGCPGGLVGKELYILA